MADRSGDSIRRWQVTAPSSGTWRVARWRLRKPGSREANRQLAETLLQLCRTRGAILRLARIVAVEQQARAGRLSIRGDALERPLAETGPGAQERQYVAGTGLDARVAQVREQLRGVRELVGQDAANPEAAAAGEH
jgi:hypothetical protein